MLRAELRSTHVDMWQRARAAGPKRKDYPWQPNVLCGLDVRTIDRFMFMISLAVNPRELNGTVAI
jgi:hypothetical protein